MSELQDTVPQLVDRRSDLNIEVPVFYNSELRDNVPQLLRRGSDLDIEAPVFFAGGKGPCYVPDREGNDEYVDARDTNYEFGRISRRQLPLVL